ncbi:MerR family transcriptional regulator [Glycomyces tarimensis]
MRIGELAQRTGTSTRVLRYYEQHGLIAAERLPNGYRDFGEHNVDRVGQIRGLIDAGIPVKIIEQILPCLGGPHDIYFPDPEPEMLALLEEQLERMTRKAECILGNRDAIADYLDRVRSGQAGEPTRDVEQQQAS